MTAETKKRLAIAVITVGQAIVTPYASYAAQAELAETGKRIISEMNQTSDCSFYSKVPFETVEDVKAFVNFFRQEYYNGDSPLVFQYAGEPGSYKIKIEASSPMKSIADEHEDNSELISEISKSLAGETEEDTVNHVIAYVEEALYYDYEVMEIIKQENLKLAAGPVSRQYKMIGHSLTTGSAVCYNYAMLAQRLLQEKGIQSAVVMNQNHAFNLIRIGGQDFLYDITAADCGYGNETKKIPFCADGLEQLRNLTGGDYTITSYFPQDYFEQ